jgi:hypothetical protein
MTIMERQCAERLHTVITTVRAPSSWPSGRLPWRGAPVTIGHDLGGRVVFSVIECWPMAARTNNYRTITVIAPIGPRYGAFYVSSRAPAVV